MAASTAVWSVWAASTSAHSHQSFACASLDRCQRAFHATCGTALSSFGGDDDPLSVDGFRTFAGGDVEVGAAEDTKRGMSTAHQTQSDRKMFSAKKAFRAIDRIKHPIFRCTGVVSTMVQKGEDSSGVRWPIAEETASVTRPSRASFSGSRSTALVSSPTKGVLGSASRRMEATMAWAAKSATVTGDRSSLVNSETRPKSC